MSLRRLISVLSVVAVATGGVALAQPKKGAPPAPAKEPAPPAAGSATAPGDGSAVAPIEDAPPSDMEGTDENPDAPHTEEPTGPQAPVVVTKPAGYPVEEVLRPIVLPANMAEVSIAPHLNVSPYQGTDALRARYGITRQVQLGLTYVMYGVYDDPFTTVKKYAFHVGKAAGLDVTVLLQNWLAVRVGLPIYFEPFAMSLAIGVPMKFRFTNKFAITLLDDLLNVRLNTFAPSFYSELDNAVAAARNDNNTTQSRGRLRFSGNGFYQYQPNLALFGRLAVTVDDFASNRNNFGYGGVTTQIRAGLQWTPKRFLDLGGSLGFDDLSAVGSFGVAGYLALRI